MILDTQIFMGRWSQYDEDDYRLPEGMKRVGYDSDSGRYYFRDADSTYWRGAQGEYFGEMTKVEDSEVPNTILPGNNDGYDLEASPRPRNGDYEMVLDEEHRPMAHNARVSVDSFRSLFPFFLIIAVVILLIWRLVIPPGLWTPARVCPEGTSLHWIQPGESCWELSSHHGWSLEKFKEANPKVVCDPLMPGTSVCLPPSLKDNAKGS